MNVFGKLRVAAARGCVVATGLASLAHGVRLGDMQGDKILFLGNGKQAHPSDKGMAAIADILFKAILAHSEAK